jgi:hypothetical protein
MCATRNSEAGTGAFTAPQYTPLNCITNTFDLYVIPFHWLHQIAPLSGGSRHTISIC